LNVPARAPHPCLAEGLAPEVHHRLRVLHVEGRALYASRGLELHRSTDGGATFQFVARAPGDLLERRLARTSLVARVLRAGFHGLTPLPSGDLVATVRGGLLHLAAGEARFRWAHLLRRGKRPLSVCRHPSGRLYFGEYFSNPRREEVHIYGSEDGRSWEVTASFPAGAIRHVHGIVHDPYREGMWVLTGDEDEECGLWWTDDEFSSIEPVLRGDQRARAVTVLPLTSGLVVPMDTPQEENFVQHLDPQSGRLERLADLPGSAFHAARTRDLWLISTAVEASAVNTDDRPALFASRDGHDWRCVARFHRDLPRLARTRSLFQWPTLVLPTGESELPTVFASGQSLLGAHDRCLAWNEGDLLDVLPLPAPRLCA